MRLGLRPGQEPQLVWMPCVAHLARCLIKGRRDRGRWGVKSPQTPLPRGSFKVGCHHVPEKEPALCCLVRVSKLSPWRGVGGSGAMTLRRRQRPVHTPALRSWAKHLSFGASGFTLTAMGMVIPTFLSGYRDRRRARKPCV